MFWNMDQTIQSISRVRWYGHFRRKDKNNRVMQRSDWHHCEKCYRNAVRCVLWRTNHTVEDIKQRRRPMIMCNTTADTDLKWSKADGKRRLISWGWPHKRLWQYVVFYKYGTNTLQLHCCRIFIVITITTTIIITFRRYLKTILLPRCNECAAV